ncbi:MAG TPA: hypothetical protein VLX92_12290 [Kofleriaceae bacterium]|nr:hypothetical protein [Kofleriaceae bacterium]
MRLALVLIALAACHKARTHGPPLDAALTKAVLAVAPNCDRALSPAAVDGVVCKGTGLEIGLRAERYEGATELVMFRIEVQAPDGKAAFATARPLLAMMTDQAGLELCERTMQETALDDTHTPDHVHLEAGESIGAIPESHQPPTWKAEFDW